MHIVGIKHRSTQTLSIVGVDYKRFSVLVNSQRLRKMPTRFLARLIEIWPYSEIKIGFDIDKDGSTKENIIWIKNGFAILSNSIPGELVTSTSSKINDFVYLYFFLHSMFLEKNADSEKISKISNMLSVIRDRIDSYNISKQPSLVGNVLIVDHQPFVAKKINYDSRNSDIAIFESQTSIDLSFVMLVKRKVDNGSDSRRINDVSLVRAQNIRILVHSEQGNLMYRAYDARIQYLEDSENDSVHFSVVLKLKTEKDFTTLVNYIYLNSQITSYLQIAFITFYNVLEKILSERSEQFHIAVPLKLSNEVHFRMVKSKDMYIQSISPIFILYNTDLNVFIRCFSISLFFVDSVSNPTLGKFRHMNIFLIGDVDLVYRQIQNASDDDLNKFIFEYLLEKVDRIHYYSRTIFGEIAYIVYKFGEVAI